MVFWKWPSDFPPNCPPDEAGPADGPYYRIVNNDPPNLGDFVSVYHLNRERAKNQIKDGKISLCETMGLSTFTDEEHARACARQFPRLGNKIVKLILGDEAGKVLPTPREIWISHHTWWQTIGFDPIGSTVVVTDVRLI